MGPHADLKLAGPAAQALREYQLGPDAVHWLQTNFLKAELELSATACACLLRDRASATLS